MYPKIALARPIRVRSPVVTPIGRDPLDLAEVREGGIRPSAPRHNGKVERYNRLLADDVLYIRP